MKHPLKVAFIVANGLVMLSFVLAFQLFHLVPQPTYSEALVELPATPPVTAPINISLTPTATIAIASKTPIPTPVRLRQVGGNLFCVTAHLDDRYWSDQDVTTQISLLKNLGVGWVRFDISEVVAESERSYSYYDRLIDPLNRNGIGVILIIDQWGQKGKPWKANFTDAPAYGAFAGRVAEHFRGKKIIYQLGNEPDYRDMDIPTYSKLMISAYDAIKAKDPKAFVITAGVGTSHAMEWLHGMYVNGVKGKFDGFGLHRYVYPSAPNPGQFAILRQLRNVMKENGEDKQIYITELGWMTGGEEGVSEAQQAQYIQEAYGFLSKDHKASVGTACLYRLADKNHEDDDAHFGIVVQDLSQPDGYSEKPGFCAIRNIINSTKEGPNISCK